jgi:hypothetical protein
MIWGYQHFRPEYTFHVGALFPRTPGEGRNRKLNSELANGRLVPWSMDVPRALQLLGVS